MLLVWPCGPSSREYSGLREESLGRVPHSASVFSWAKSALILDHGNVKHSPKCSSRPFQTLSSSPACWGVQHSPYCSPGPWPSAALWAWSSADTWPCWRCWPQTWGTWICPSCLRQAEDPPRVPRTGQSHWLPVPAACAASTSAQEQCKHTWVLMKKKANVSVCDCSHSYSYIQLEFLWRPGRGMEVAGHEAYVRVQVRLGSPNSERTHCQKTKQKGPRLNNGVGAVFCWWFVVRQGFHWQRRRPVAKGQAMKIMSLFLVVGGEVIK